MLSSYEKKQVNTQAKRDLVKKLQLERRFRPEIKSLFARMNRDFKIRVAANGIPPRTSNYRAAWESALNKHYERVQKSFLGTVTEFNQKRFVSFETKLFEDLLLIALLEWAEERAANQSLFIMQTNESNMIDALNQARQALIEQELPVDNKSLSEAASKILRRKTNGRISAIETLETQAPAESTKLFEARTVGGLRPTDTGISDLTKTWRTMGDKIVRPAHQAANFQTVNINDPFIVKGQSLMYAGDTSLGASLDNVMG